MDINLSKLWEIVEDRGGCCAAVYVVAKKSDTTLQLNNNNHMDILYGGLHVEIESCVRFMEASWCGQWFQSLSRVSQNNAVVIGQLRLQSRAATMAEDKLRT